MFGIDTEMTAGDSNTMWVQSKDIYSNNRTSDEEVRRITISTLSDWCASGTSDQIRSDQIRQRHEFCIKSDEFCIINDEFCITNAQDGMACGVILT